ncbi:MAG: V-type ATPase subunit a family protein [Helicobacter sp.]|nr:V-type ATPase subunit a family protein [Helicobacter sp.]
MRRGRNQVGIDWFAIITLIVSIISGMFYGVIIAFLAGFARMSSIYDTNDVIFIYLIFFIGCFLPPPLALIADKNKRDIEALFFLGYMVFAPMITIFLFDSTSNSKDSNSTFFLILAIFILSIPFLFLFKNCYLWYKNKKLNKSQPIEKDLESTSKAKEELTIPINHPKELLNYKEKNENTNSLDEISDFIKCVSVGASVGVIVGAFTGFFVGGNMGASIGAIAGFFAGCITGVRVGSVKYAIAGAIAGIVAGFFMGIGISNSPFI